MREVDDAVHQVGLGHDGVSRTRCVPDAPVSRLDRPGFVDDWRPQAPRASEQRGAAEPTLRVVLERADRRAARPRWHVGRVGRVREHPVQLAADDLAERPPAPPATTRRPTEPAARLAQHPALAEVEGGERAGLVAAARRSRRGCGWKPSRESSFQKNAGAHHRRRPLRQRPQRADEHPVQRRGCAPAPGRPGRRPRASRPRG